MPNTPSPKAGTAFPDDDAYEDIYEAESFEDLTPMDALIVAGMLLDHEMPVPTDIIAKCHSAGLYIAH